MMKTNKKVNIMHITYDMRIGGTEMVIKNIIDGSDKSLFTMSVLCIEAPLGPFADELISLGIQFTELKRQPGFDKGLIKNIRTAINKNNIDIIHCHQYTPWVYGVIAAAFTKTKVIFTEHGRFYPDSSTWKRKLINPLLNIFTDQVTAISKATKQALVEYENITKESIAVIYNGIAPLNINHESVSLLKKELGINDNTKIVGTIARFDPIKNHVMMLEAFHQVLMLHSDTLLIIVGDGDERTTIESTITRLNISKNVILTGYKTNPKSYLALMDIYLLSSLSEGTSMTLLEAMSIGKPCVVTDAGGNPEIIIDGKNGLVTENDNPQAFSQAINNMLESSSLNNYQQEALSIYNALFSIINMSSHYSKVYQHLCQSPVTDPTKNDK